MSYASTHGEAAHAGGGDVARRDRLAECMYGVIDVAPGATPPTRTRLVPGSTWRIESTRLHPPHPHSPALMMFVRGTRDGSKGARRRAALKSG